MNKMNLFLSQNLYFIVNLFDLATQQMTKIQSE